MKLNLYSVYDAKVEAYAVPFFCRSDGEAIRLFAFSCQDESTRLSQAPEDYVLFFLGEFEDQNGDVLGAVPARSVINGSDAARLYQK